MRQWLVIRQLNHSNWNKGSLRFYDFVKSKIEFPIGERFYLNNINRNGYQFSHNEAHTDLILIFFK